MTAEFNGTAIPTGATETSVSFPKLPVIDPGVPVTVVELELKTTFPSVAFPTAFVSATQPTTISFAFGSPFGIEFLMQVEKPVGSDAGDGQFAAKVVAGNMGQVGFFDFRQIDILSASLSQKHLLLATTDDFAQTQFPD